MIGQTNLGIGEGAATEGVRDEILALIRAGELLPGARLPSERTLAERFGVSRPTVRQAISSLVQMGALTTRQGSGTVVALSGAEVLRLPFEMLLLLDKPSLTELYEVRELIEVHLAGRAAERRTEDDLARLTEALTAMREAVTHPAQMTDPNLQFHQAVAHAAHVPTLERFMGCLHDGIRACIEATRPGVRDWIISYEAHERIYQAIASRSATDARRAMTLHFAIAIEELERAELLPKRHEEYHVTQPKF
jgi:GntR family transcriptional repressor for pyruvate dehydrogenase complex